MSVESRIRQASSELEAALSQTAIPRLPDRSKSRILVSVVVGIAVVAGMALPILFLTVKAPSDSRGPSSQVVDTTTVVSLLPGTISPRLMTGPIGVIDPSGTRQQVLDRLAFDLDPFGSEYRLVSVDDPESLRPWFMPSVRNQPGQWNWMVVGQIEGFDTPVVVATSGSDTVVCAGLESGVMSCVGDGFQALSDQQFSPAVWLVPEGTAVAAFAEHDNKGWQVPSGGAVAFPRSQLSSGATLTAYDLQGGIIGQIEFDQLVEANQAFDQLPQPPTVDLMRVLLDRQVPTIVDTDIIESAPAAEAILGVSKNLTVRFTHVDGSVSFGIIVSDGVRGVAIWTKDAAILTAAFADDPVAEDHGDFETADHSNRLIVSRGVTIQEIVERWNAALDVG